MVPNTELGPRQVEDVSSEQITVLHVDDHPVFCYGIETLINAQPDMVLVAQASTGRQGIEYFRRQKTDVILLDLRLPDMSGIEAMIEIRAEFPDARCIILTTFELEDEIRRALAEGAPICSRACLLASWSMRFARFTREK